MQSTEIGGVRISRSILDWGEREWVDKEVMLKLLGK